MTTRAAHIARAERLLDGAEAHTATEAALLAAAHATVALVRHETGIWDDGTDTEGSE